jgi:hypothetical protein
MAFKIFAGILAALLLITFVSPVVIKLKEIALIIVALAGLAMMVTDIWHSLKSKDD